MQPIRVDLNTRVLTDKHQVFIARPGKSYRLYAVMADAEAILLELPSLGLESDTLAGDQEDLLLKVARAKAVRSWHRAGRPGDKIPSSNLSDYAKRTGGQSVGQLQGMVKALFDRAQKGDLVVMPPSSFMQDAYIGEFVDPPGRSIEVPSDRFYPGDLLPGRRVKWLAKIPKRKLAPEIIAALNHPTVYYLLEKSLRSDIYRAAYPSYVVDEGWFNARFDVSSEDFTAKDDFLIQAFFNFVAANEKAIDENKLSQVAGIEVAAFKSLGDYDLDLQSNINSPGFLILLSRYATPLVAATLFALAVEVGPGAVQAAENGVILLQNSRSTQDDSCTVQVHEHVLRHLQLLGLDKWPKACEIAREAAKRTGIKSSVKVK